MKKILVIGDKKLFQYKSIESYKFVHTTKIDKLQKYIEDVSIVIVDHNIIRNMNDAMMVEALCRSMNIDVIMITDTTDTESALKYSVSDYLVKPIDPKMMQFKLNKFTQNSELIRGVSSYNSRLQDENERLQRIIYRNQRELTSILSEIIEVHDIDSDGKNIRISLYMKLFLETLMEVPNEYQYEVSKWDKDTHISACQLHDVGKMGISDTLLLKNTSLTNEEYHCVKQHIEIGIDIVKRIVSRIGESEYLNIVMKYVSSHHERWDGHGYQNSLVGDSIPLECRIFAIIDTFDALTTDKSYKRKVTVEDAVRVIESESGNQFDPELVRVFVLTSKKIVL